MKQTVSIYKNCIHNILPSQDFVWFIWDYICDITQHNILFIDCVKETSFLSYEEFSNMFYFLTGSSERAFLCRYQVSNLLVPICWVGRSQVLK